MTRPVVVLLTVALSVLLHVTLGWEATSLSAISAGFLIGHRGWLFGGITLVAGWGALVAYSFIVAPHETAAMTTIFSGILGNLPAAATVAATLLLAAMIGVLGGLLGSLLAALRSIRSTESRRILV